MTQPVRITAFYRFTPIAHIDTLRAELLAFGQERGMRGLVLLAEEGINGTVCGAEEVIAEWKKVLTDRFGGITFKDSAADGPVFKRWSVKRKPEIVGLKRPDIRPEQRHRHLSPEEWQAMLEREDVVVLDARNDYEYAVGAFKGAVNPGIRRFSEFPDYVKSADIPKDRKVLMYCTGGIRCEKAIHAMEEAGYNEVYQLDGGILAYLEKFPETNFEGECFVFDERAAVGQRLEPSATFGICPHCGLPGDHPVDCARCGMHGKVCTACATDAARMTCSKRCANELLAVAH